MSLRLMVAYTFSSLTLLFWSCGGCVWVYLEMQGRREYEIREGRLCQGWGHGFGLT